MSEQTEGVILTIRARNLSDLKQKLISHLAELGVTIEEEEAEREVEVEFPDEIKRIYPDYEDNPHSAAMLTVLYENHRGRANQVSSWELAEEMKERFPELFRRKSIKKISWGNIFAGTRLEKSGLIHIERDEEDRRTYWVD
jgi:hypothetical protein